ncbi:hypothetical protein Bbelb_166620 [Branchiostoma belcheri]|nr:hypothetical protein Bbelb_166620 [Branchiostoma belcheri]
MDVTLQLQLVTTEEAKEEALKTETSPEPTQLGSDESGTHLMIIRASSTLQHTPKEIGRTEAVFSKLSKLEVTRVKWTSSAKEKNILESLQQLENCGSACFGLTVEDSIQITVAQRDLDLVCPAPMTSLKTNTTVEDSLQRTVAQHDLDSVHPAPMTSLKTKIAGSLQ